MESGISNCVALGVPDMREAADYYERTLGYRTLVRTERYIEQSTGPLRIFLCEEAVVAPIFEIFVDDLDLVSRALVENGFEPTDEAHTMTDPFGHRYRLSER